VLKKSPGELSLRGIRLCLDFLLRPFGANRKFLFKGLTSKAFAIWRSYYIPFLWGLCIKKALDYEGLWPSLSRSRQIRAGGKFILWSNLQNQPEGSIILSRFQEIIHNS
jgi:hypothetical protein